MGRGKSVNTSHNICMSAIRRDGHLNLHDTNPDEDVSSESKEGWSEDKTVKSISGINEKEFTCKQTNPSVTMF